MNGAVSRKIGLTPREDTQGDGFFNRLPALADVEFPVDVT
jgi:hypothetical protein